MGNRFVPVLVIVRANSKLQREKTSKRRKFNPMSGAHNRLIRCLEAREQASGDWLRPVTQAGVEELRQKSCIIAATNMPSRNTRADNNGSGREPLSKAMQDVKAAMQGIAAVKGTPMHDTGHAPGSHGRENAANKGGPLEDVSALPASESRTLGPRETVSEHGPVAPAVASHRGDYANSGANTTLRKRSTGEAGTRITTGRTTGGGPSVHASGWRNDTASRLSVAACAVAVTIKHSLSLACDTAIYHYVITQPAA